jgi:hypothetical protein
MTTKRIFMCIFHFEDHFRQAPCRTPSFDLLRCCALSESSSLHILILKQTHLENAASLFLCTRFSSRVQVCSCRPLILMIRWIV